MYGLATWGGDQVLRYYRSPMGPSTEKLQRTGQPGHCVDSSQRLKLQATNKYSKTVHDLQK